MSNLYPGQGGRHRQLLRGGPRRRGTRGSRRGRRAQPALAEELGTDVAHDVRLHAARRRDVQRRHARHHRRRHLLDRHGAGRKISPEHRLLLGQHRVGRRRPRDNAGHHHPEVAGRRLRVGAVRGERPVGHVPGVRRGQRRRDRHARARCSTAPARTRSPSSCPTRRSNSSGSTPGGVARCRSRPFASTSSPRRPRASSPASRVTSTWRSTSRSTRPRRGRTPRTPRSTSPPTAATSASTSTRRRAVRRHPRASGHRARLRPSGLRRASCSTATVRSPPR